MEGEERESKERGGDEGRTETMGQRERGGRERENRRKEGE